MSRVIEMPSRAVSTATFPLPRENCDKSDEERRVESNFMKELDDVSELPAAGEV
jgi:hypothetical protein